MNRFQLIAIASAAWVSAAAAQSGDAGRGREDFRACGPCHSLEPDRNMTGPSLAGLWGRKAGSLPSFERYSDALTSSGIIWDDRALDAWLTDPQRMVPGNEMPFEGIKDALVRADLLAFLREATGPGAPQQTAEQRGMKGMGGMMGGMGGMMGAGRDSNLKNIEAPKKVQAVTHCHDTFRVTTADGKTRAFWERNLRFMIDSGRDGPEPGAPAIMRAGMMGDRVAVIFADPEELARFIAKRC